MTALLIVQARMGSSRFPGKSLAEIEGRPILWHQFRQLAHCRHETTAVLATTVSALDNPLAAYGESQGWNVFRGDEDDVLARYHDAAVAFGAAADTVVVRLTGDDILPDPRLIDAALDLHDAFKGKFDCVFTADDDSLPYGIDHESYVFSALERAHREAADADDREHVTPYIRRNSAMFPQVEITVSETIPGPPLSIDTPADLERTRELLKRLNARGSGPHRIADIVEAAAALDVGDPR